MSQIGLTMIEMLIVIAILGILAAIAVPQLRAPASRVAADSVSSTIQHGRFEAIKLNRPVVVRVDPDNSRIDLVEGNDATVIDCAAEAKVLRTLELDDYRRVAFSGGATEFVWLPSGQLRACNGAWLTADVTLELTDERRSSTVHVSTGGEVTVQ